MNTLRTINRGTEPPATFATSIPQADPVPVKPSRTWKTRLAIGLWATAVAAMIILVAAAGWVMWQSASGAVRYAPVVTGSMGNVAPVGAVAITKQVPIADLKVGDIIVFQPPTTDDTTLRIHRIVDIDRSSGKTMVVTKGDANNTVDAWSPMELTGKNAWVFQSKVDGLGYVLLWLGNPRHRLIVVFVFALLGAVLFAAPSFTRWFRSRKSVTV
jgi:signal peptidase